MIGVTAYELPTRPVARHKDDHLSNRDLLCGFDEQVNYFSEPIS